MSIQVWKDCEMMAFIPGGGAKSCTFGLHWFWKLREGLSVWGD